MFDLKSFYDAEVDIMYIRLGKPVACINRDGPGDMLLRFNIENNEPHGITIFDYKEYWLRENYRGYNKKELLRTEISKFFNIAANYIIIRDESIHSV